MKKGLLGFCLGCVLTTTLWASQASGRRSDGAVDQVVLQVNGSRVLDKQFDVRLRGVFGAQLLAELVQELLVEQQAQKDGVSLSEEDNRKLLDSVRSVPNPDTKVALLASRRSQLLIRKLILKDFSEEALRRFHSLFPREFTQYEVSLLILASEADAQLAWNRIQERVLTFEQLSNTYSLAPNPGGKVGYLVLSQIERKFGRKIAEAFELAKPGDVFPPMYCAEGLIIFKLGAVKSRFEDVRGLVEDVVIEGRRVAFRERLSKGAVIESRYIGPVLPPSLKEGGGAGSDEKRPGLKGALKTSAPTVPGLAPPSSEVSSTPTPVLRLPR